MLILMIFESRSQTLRDFLHQPPPLKTETDLKNAKKCVANKIVLLTKCKKKMCCVNIELNSRYTFSGLGPFYHKFSFFGSFGHISSVFDTLSLTFQAFILV
jgi:hypothetical protein